MKLDKVEYPFSDLYKNGYVLLGQNGRKNVCLSDKANGNTTTIAYARYLMSVKLGRFLTKDEEVDHIDNDPTNDSIDNLQILSGEANRKKYFDLRDAQHAHGTMYWYRKGCRCPDCVEGARSYERAKREEAKKRLAMGILPKTPEERYPTKAAEKRLGRPLIHGECFWHLDGNTSNNTEENLIIFKTFLDRKRFKASGANVNLLIRNEDGTCSMPQLTITQRAGTTSKAKAGVYSYKCAQCGIDFSSHIKRHSDVAFCSQACFRLYEAEHRVSKCPPVEELIKAFEELKTFRGVSGRYGVSDNTSRKWCIKLGILDKIKPIIDASKKDTLRKNSRPKTADEKAAMVARLKEYWNKHPKESPSISVDKVDPVTGVVLHTYTSMREAARDGFVDHCIAKCCRDTTKKHKGYKWRFHDDTTVTETT